MKNKPHVNIGTILKQPLNRNPISANFIAPVIIKKPLIEPIRTVASFDQSGKDKIEMWLAFCVIGTTILETGTKMLSHMGVIHKRDAVFDLVKAFKELRGYFNGNENFDTKERVIDDFVASFLMSDEATQNRVIKFQESILNKNSK